MIATLINCSSKLQALGIDLTTSSGRDKLEQSLIQTVPNLECWDYVFSLDVLHVCYPNSSPTPDLSSFGEVSDYDNSMG